MRINDNVLESAHQMLVILLRYAENADATNVFGLNSLRPTELEIIARATTQLIEVCSWMEIMEDARPKLGNLIQVLQRFSARDLGAAPIHPSRLKAILLYGDYDKQAFSEAMDQLCGDRDIYCGNRLSIQHLSFIDLLGAFIHLTEEARFSRISMRGRLRKRVIQIHSEEIKRLLTAAMDTDLNERTDLSAISYFIRLLIVNRLTDDAAVRDKVKQLCDNIIQNVVNLARKDHLNHYQEWLFPRVAYAFSVLLWCQRRWNWQIEDMQGADMWFSACSQELLVSHHPYNMALFIKPILAARKLDFLRLHQRNGLDAIIRLQEDHAKLKEASITNDIMHALRAAIDVEASVENRLTAGWSRASVYSVRAAIRIPAAEDNAQIEKEYVVKLGQKEDIVHASTIYNSVPEDVRKLFARHQGNTYYGTIGQNSQHFIIMEYLQNHQELSRWITEFLPPDNTAVADMGKIEKSIRSALSLVKSLHAKRVTETPIFKTRRSLKIKIADLYKYESDISKKSSVLSAISAGGHLLAANGESLKLYPSSKVIGGLISWPGGKLVSPKTAKKNARFVLTHGDCHANNVMISKDFKTAVFIDIADVHIDDYLEDYAQLAAHVCFSSNLEHISDSDLTSLLTIRPGLENPENLDSLYPERWPALKLIWQQIYDNILEAAEAINDIRAVTRFCVLLGRRLLFVASKSPSEVKSYILYLQGMMLLQRVLDQMKRTKDEKVDIVIPPGDWMKITLAK